ncbi:MAG: DSBA-like thioredoxin protein [Candidatus Nomurabacteria bacterium]|jgi:protein-disulfide isomerase|nr:DSBA-like thioredoxin protein [Candidatus Nomurabacteria bacterium]
MEPQENPQKDPIENSPISTVPPKPAISIAAAILTGAAMTALALIIVLHPSNTAPSPTTGAISQPTTPTTVPAAIVTVRPGDANHIRGDINTAQVVIFEYSDSDCPFCEQFHPTLQQVVSDYQGKVAWVYRYFPLSIHPNTHTEAIALQCAGQLGGAKGFNTYLDTIINITLNPDTKSNEMLTTIASQQGLDATKFNACRADPATAAMVDASSQEAQSIGAQGTPFSIAVNIKTGKQIIIPGAYPLAEVKKDIDSLLQ